MPKAYWIVHVCIKDERTYRFYLDAARVALQRFHPKFLASGGRYQQPEGKKYNRHLLIEFESMDKALECYHSPEYKAAREFRVGAADTDIIILEGLPPNCDF